MKNVLLLIHDDPGQEARLQAALDLTRGLEGHLTCIDVVRMPLIADDYAGGQASAMLLAEECSREAANRAVIEDRLSHEDVPWDWIDATGDIAGCVLQAADLADLIVVNRKVDASPVPDMRGIAGTVAMRSHKPLVAMPEDARGFDVAGRALIAWDGSPPVVATMQACVPLLKLAESVCLLTVDDGSEGVPVEEAAAYLSRHGIFAEVKRIHDRVRRADDHIVAQCTEWRADYCMMGAFGHGRLTEFVFGGVTRRMIGSCKIPLVLGH